MYLDHILITSFCLACLAILSDLIFKIFTSIEIVKNTQNQKSSLASELILTSPATSEAIGSSLHSAIDSLVSRYSLLSRFFHFFNLSFFVFFSVISLVYGYFGNQIIEIKFDYSMAFDERVLYSWLFSFLIILHLISKSEWAHLTYVGISEGLTRSGLRKGILYTLLKTNLIPFFIFSFLWIIFYQLVSLLNYLGLGEFFVIEDLHFEIVGILYFFFFAYKKYKYGENLSNIAKTKLINIRNSFRD